MVQKIKKEADKHIVAQVVINIKKGGMVPRGRVCWGEGSVQERLK